MFSSPSASTSSSSGVSLDDRLPVTSFSESLSSTPRSSTGSSDRSFIPTSHVVQLARCNFERNRPVATKKRWRQQHPVLSMSRSSGDAEECPPSRRNSHEQQKAMNGVVTVTNNNGFPAGFGGWNPSKLYEARVDREERAGNSTPDRHKPPETITSVTSSVVKSASDDGPDPETERKSVSYNYCNHFLN